MRQSKALKREEDTIHIEALLTNVMVAKATGSIAWLDRRQS